MGKIESGEIGEVDPLPDSGNSLALIRYAKQAVSSHSPQNAERGGSLREEDRGNLSPHLSVQHLPLGIGKVFLETLFCFLHLFVFLTCLPAEWNRSKGNAFWELHKQRDEFQKSCNCLWFRGVIGNNNTDLGGVRLPGGDEGEGDVSCIRIFEQAVCGSVILRSNFGPEFYRLLLEETVVGDEAVFTPICCFSWRHSCWDLWREWRIIFTNNLIIMTYFCQWKRLLSFSFFIFASSFARIVLKHHSRHPRTVELLWSQFMLHFFLNTLFDLTEFL